VDDLKYFLLLYNEMPGYNVQAVERRTGVWMPGRNIIPSWIQTVSIRQAGSSADLFIPAGNFWQTYNRQSFFSVVSRNKSTQKFYQPGCFAGIFLRNRSR
jgi:hypothetical protein